MLQSKAYQQRSKIPFRDFHWIGPYLVKKVLQNNKPIIRKFITNKTQIIHRICFWKYNPEKPPEDNYQEAQWHIDDIIVIPQDELYTNAWEEEFGGHLFDIHIIYNDPNAIDFDESYKQGPDTDIAPCSCFHGTSGGQNRESCPTSDPSAVHPSNPKLYGQSQHVETYTDLHHNDNSKQTPESSRDIETGYEPMVQPPSRQSDNPSTLEINDPTTGIIPQNEPSHSRGGKYNLSPNPNPNYSEIYRYWCAQKFISAPFVCHSYLIVFFFTRTSFNFFFSILWGQIHKTTQNRLEQQYFNKQDRMSQFYSKRQDDSASAVLRFDRILPANKSNTPLCCVFPISIRRRCAGRRRCSG